MKKAFTLVELIFVIVILGILSGAAVMSIPDNHLYSDINFITAKIKQKQMDAFLYDPYDFNDPSWRDSYHDRSCIDTATLKNDEQQSLSAKKYQLKSTITAKKICFDALGRPFIDDYKLNHFIKSPILLDITYKSTTRKLKIMPYSGSIMIER